MYRWFETVFSYSVNIKEKFSSSVAVKITFQNHCKSLEDAIEQGWAAMEVLTKEQRTHLKNNATLISVTNQ